MNTKNFTRNQLKQCFLDLGERAVELDEKYIATICFIAAGSIIEGSDEYLCRWMSEFAKIRINQIKDDLEKP